ncbi:MAG TPA: DUF6701 domain-containing protein [Burkholderiales bacterium]|nr:DUF6701 domain-containing protein [Burkholderiales bacterium]
MSCCAKKAPRPLFRALTHFSVLLFVFAALGLQPASAQIAFRSASSSSAAAIAFVGASAQTASNTSGATLTPVIPAASQAGDLAVLIVAGRPSDTTNPATPAGWTPRSSRLHEVGANDLKILTYYRVLTGGDANPSVTVPAAWSGGGGGMSAQIAVWRGVDASNPFDVADTTADSAAVQDWVPPAITTVTPNAWVVSVVATSDNNALGFAPGMGQGFTARMSGVTYDTTVGGDHAVALADLEQAAPGSPTMPTWRQTVNFPDSWVGITFALRPATPALTIAKPAGTLANDVLVAAIGLRPPTATIAPPAGWTLVRRLDNAAGSPNSLAVYIRVAGASEPASYTWNLSGFTHAVGGIQAFSGADTASPIDVENGQTTASGLTHATPSVTTTVANAMLVTAHTFSSSATWTPPAGMTEAYDVAVPSPPAAVGQALEGAWQVQPLAGATGAKTATASNDADTGNAHILALRPAPALPGGFNAYDTTTAAGAITGFIRTKVAGAVTSVDIIALNAARTAILTTFTGAVRVEVLDASDNSGALDANGCRPSWTVIQTLSPDPTFLPADLGRKTVSFTQPNSFRDVRIRVSWPVGAPTVIGCSNDNFALRPASFSIAVTDNTWDTAGTARALGNTSATGGNVHKAGRPFTITVTPSPASATNYDGSPTVSALACTLPAGCVNGTLDPGTFSGAGTRTSNTATYSEAGAFDLTLVDQSYASVDSGDGTPADCTASGRYVCQSPAPVAVGRFVPDRFDFVSASTPQFLTFGSASCPSRSFTYIGQRFWYAVLPSATVRALNAAGAVTQNYKGALFKLTPAGITETYSNNAVGPALDTSLIGTPSLVSNGDGTGSYTAASGGSLAYQRSVTSPIPAVNNPFTANISLAVAASDGSESAVAGNGTIATATPLVFNGGGSGIAFDAGAAFRYGRLALRNANGSQLVPLLVPIETQYWSGPPANAFVTNAADDCTTLAGTNVSMSGFQGNLGPLASCKTNMNAAITFAKGRGNLRLTAPGSGNHGSVNLTVQLGTGSFGSNSSCVTPGSPPPQPTSGADRAYLQGNWTGGNFDQNPAARATFGTFPGTQEVIFIQENFQ